MINAFRMLNMNSELVLIHTSFKDGMSFPGYFVQKV